VWQQSSGPDHDNTGDIVMALTNLAFLTLFVIPFGACAIVLAAIAWSDQ
jgi:hypothetical protein